MPLDRLEVLPDSIDPKFSCKEGLQFLHGGLKPVVQWGFLRGGQGVCTAVCQGSVGVGLRKLVNELLDT